MSLRLALALALALAAGGLAATPGFRWRLAAAEPPPPVPASNPMSDAKVELGRRLFYDGDLSVDGTLSCAACHEQHRAFTDGNATHPGVRGAPGRRNAPGLANVGYLSPLTWADPNQVSLEDQVAVPVTGEHPVEMGMHGKEAEIVRRLAGDPCYRTMFKAAFPAAGEPVTFPRVAQALAAFERTLVSRDAPFDRYRRGDAAALSEQAKRGKELFRRHGCAACHAGADFTDARFHIVSPVRGADEGAFEKTGVVADRGAFRTPSLRNVALTGPYLHDGAAKTLSEAIGAHTTGVGADDRTAIEAFLSSLTDLDFTRDPRFSLPRRFCGKDRRS